MAVRVKDRIEANIRQSDKVNNNLSIQLNGGTATVYNGSSAKSINVTPAAIGAPTKTGSGASGIWNITAQQLSSYNTPGEYTKHSLAYFNAAISNNGTARAGVNDSPSTSDTWWHFLRFTHANSSGYYTDLAIPFGTNSIYYKRISNGNVSNSGTNAGWVKVLDQLNYTSVITTASINALGAVNANGYWGMADPNKNAGVWIRTTTQGIIPYQSGGSSNLGTSSWPFSTAYINTIIEGGVALVNKYLKLTGGILSGMVHGPGFWGDQSSGENQVGVKYNGGNLYFWGNNSSGTAGIYDSLGGYVINRNTSNNKYTFYGTLSGNANTATTATTAAKLGRSGDAAAPMIFYWSGQGGQPPWLWGGSDGTNMYVYSPSNFDVNSSRYLVSSRNSNNNINTWNYGAGTMYSREDSGGSVANLPDGNWWQTLCQHSPDPNWGNQLTQQMTGGVSAYIRSFQGGTWSSWYRLWRQGDSVTGAVWNDYAEYRESDCQEFGRVLIENGNDTLSISQYRLQPFAGVSSDTWGFCQGETDKAKTPIAVAGRVLVYPYKNRNEYKAGDCVCAAPNGTVDIMTRQEIVSYPDRIVGTVSCVPDYEEWGSGDRPAVKVDGRIWIKVR